MFNKVAVAVRFLLPGLLTVALFGQQATKYLNIGSLPPDWQVALRENGDRMQKSGKERLVLTGTVTRQSSSGSFQIIHELPNSIRYQEQSGPSPLTVRFDGNQIGKDSGSVQKVDTDLVETLAYDTPNFFFYAASTGVQWRKLGSRFRIDGQKSKLYSGPSYDVYLVLDTVQQSARTKQQPKLYHVNSDSQMIERVHYQDADNPSTKVEILLDNWTTVSGNRVPQLIRRLENGAEVLRLTINAATIGPAVADGIFQGSK